jgi:hypothetical protein
LTAIRRALNIVPNSEAAAAPIDDSNSGVRPAPNMKKDRISEEQINIPPSRCTSKCVKKKSSDEREKIENLRNCEKITEFND